MSLIYSPREDSYLLESQLKLISKGKEILDMGTGSGIIALSSKKAGAKKVTAVDINKEALKNLKGKGLILIESDLFENVNGKFDIICFNPPYLPKQEGEDEESSLATTGGNKGDEIILNFLEKASSFLKNNGKILLVLSSLTPLGRIKLLLRKKKLKYSLLKRENLFFEKLFLWEITKRIKS